MASLTALKTRVILETNRDDMGSGGALEQALVDAYTRAIEFFADELFWFNRISGSKNTVASTATVAQPTGMRIPLVVSYLQRPLRKVDLADIEYLTDEGPPSAWAENEGLIQLWPIPDAVYALSIQGIEDIGVPASASASNAWTAEGYDLICARAKLILYRDYLRDTEGTVTAKIAEDEALGKLHRETRRRSATGLTSDVPPARGTFNINRGY